MRKTFIYCVAVTSLVVVAQRDAFADETGPALEPYGFVRLDAIFDDSRMQNAQFAMWVESEDEAAAGSNDAELSIHPRLSRFGVKINPRELGTDADVSGKIEIDFQNGGKESRSLMRMRHAYATLAFGDVRLLAGQTWDLLSPLYPTVNSDGMMWHAGNLGDRRPQVRISFEPAVGDGHARVAVAAGMSSAVDNGDLDGNGRLDGFDAAIPNVEALAEIDLSKLRAGISGHFARFSLGDGTDFDAYSASVHAKLSFAKAWVQGEGFVGANLSDIRGGIGQGVNGSGDEIMTVGGWLEAGCAPADTYEVAVGATIDDPKDDDVDDAGRKQNLAAYASLRIAPWKNVIFGAEYLFWNTRYKGLRRGRANRANLHLTMKF